MQTCALVIYESLKLLFGIKANWNGVDTAAHFEDSPSTAAWMPPKYHLRTFPGPGWCLGCDWGSLRRVLHGQDQNLIRDRLKITLAAEIPMVEKAPLHFKNFSYYNINLCQQLYLNPQREQRMYILYDHVWINCLIKLPFNFSFIKYVNYIPWFFHFKIYFTLL